MGLTNSQYDEVMRSYSLKRNRYADELDRRKTLIFEKIPRIREIEDEIASKSAAHARLAIAGRSSGKDSLLAELDALAAEKEALLKKAGFSSADLQMHFDCGLCRDTGTYEGGRCKCFKTAAAALLYRQSGLENVLKLENFDSFDLKYYPDTFTKDIGGETIGAGENMRDVLRTCRDYVDGFSSSHASLLFTGPAGCGKTFMTHCIAGALMDKGISVIYQSAGQFYEALSKRQFRKFDDGDNDTADADMFTEVDLLIIDDLGTEFQNSFTNSKLFDIINERLSQELATVISTNLSLEDIRNTYSDRIYSRIVGSFMILPFFGPDIRKQKIFE